MPDPLLENATASAFRWIVQLIREPEDPALLRAIQEPQVAAPEVWREVTRLALYHRVEGIVSLNLIQHPGGGVPGDIRRHFDDRRRELVPAALSRLALNLGAYEALREAGTSPVLLKGAIVAKELYGDLVTRDNIDADIFIDLTSVGDAQRALQNQGFVRVFPEAEFPDDPNASYWWLTNTATFLNPTNGSQIDLHWRLFQNPHFLSWDRRFVANHINESELGGRGVKGLTGPALAVHLLCHGGNHAWASLHWLCDIYRLARKAPDPFWLEVERLSRENGVVPAASAGLRLTADTFDMTLGPAATQLANAVEVSSRSYSYAQEKLHSVRDHIDVRPGDIGEVVRNTRYLMSLKRKARYRRWVMIDLLTDARHLSTFDLPRGWLPLYVALNAVTSVWRIAMRGLRPARTRRAAG